MSGQTIQISQDESNLLLEVMLKAKQEWGIESRDLVMDFLARQYQQYTPKIKDNRN